MGYSTTNALTKLIKIFNELLWKSESEKAKVRQKENILSTLAHSQKTYNGFIVAGQKPGGRNSIGLPSRILEAEVFKLPPTSF